MRLLLFLGREQVHRNDLAEARAPASRHRLRRQQSRLPLEPRSMSTLLYNLRGSSLARPVALYRALVAGPRSVMAAARLSRGRGRRERIERE